MKLLLLFLTCIYANEMCSFNSTFENMQPSGSMNYGLLNVELMEHDLFLDNNPQIIFFNKVYKKHTNFVLEMMENNSISIFGTEVKIDFMFGTLYSYPVPKVLNIALPPIYVDNQTSRQCNIF